MKIVVAGGSGLIGQALVNALIDRGHDVVVLSRRDPPMTTGRVVRWSPPSLGAWTRELTAAHAVVNLAGLSVGGWWWTSRRRRLLRESRLLPTRTLVAAFRAMPARDRPRVLVNASGTDVYEGQDAEPADEATQPSDTFLSRLVLDWEAAASEARDLSLRVVLLRTSLVLAPDAPAFRLLTLPVRLGFGGPLGSGRQWLSWIALPDVVGLALLAIDDRRAEGPLNASAPDPRPQADFVAALGSALGRSARLRVPERIIRFAAGDMSVLALGSRRVWPGQALGLGYRFQTPRLEAALRGALRPVPVTR